MSRYGKDASERIAEAQTNVWQMVVRWVTIRQRGADREGPRENQIKVN